MRKAVAMMCRSVLVRLHFIKMNLYTEPSRLPSGLTACKTCAYYANDWSFIDHSITAISSSRLYEQFFSLQITHLRVFL